jgi:hypothetical protein
MGLAAMQRMLDMFKRPTDPPEYNNLFAIAAGALLTTYAIGHFEGGWPRASWLWTGVLPPSRCLVLLAIGAVDRGLVAWIVQATHPGAPLHICSTAVGLIFIFVIQASLRAKLPMPHGASPRRACLQTPGGCYASSAPAAQQLLTAAAQ